MEPENHGFPIGISEFPGAENFRFHVKNFRGVNFIGSSSFLPEEFASTDFCEKKDDHIAKG